LEINVTVLEEESFAIECPSVVCENTTTTYSIADKDCGEKGKWTVEGGIITNYNGANIEVNWDRVDESGFGYVYFDSRECNVKCGGITSIRNLLYNKVEQLKEPVLFVLIANKCIVYQLLRCI
jgi:hypothetical protein